MPTGFPFSDGQVLSGSTMNSLAAFTVNAQTGTTYTLASTDQYQVIITMDNASSNTLYIPTDATYNFGVGTTVTILQKGAGVTTVTATTPGTTTVVSPGATSASPVLTRYRSCIAIKIASNSWIVTGAVS